MKNFFRIIVFLFLLTGLSSFAIHKFYVSIYQINFVPKKQMIQITSRIFVDDMNEVLEKKYHKKTFLGSEKEATNDEVLMKNYILEKLILKVNGTTKPLTYISKEIEANVIICYLKIPNVSKLNTLSVENSSLMELNDDQQNIVQLNIDGDKQSLLLTSDNYRGMLK